MALSDPQTVTTSAAFTLNRISDDNGKSEYWSSDRTTKESVESKTMASGRTRHIVRLTTTKVAADPLTAINKSLDATISLTWDCPAWGFTEAEKLQLLSGLVTQLTAGTNAVAKQILGFQH